MVFWNRRRPPDSTTRRRRSTWSNRRRYLLFINGEPFTTAVGDTGLEVVGNANFPVFRDTKSGNYYLLSGDQRYMSAKLAGPWGTVAELPPAFRKIPAQGEFASIAAVVATPPKAGAAPAVITTFKPAEIVVLDGKPRGPRDRGHRRP